jgi:hypothetical protein
VVVVRRLTWTLSFVNRSGETRERVDGRVGCGASGAAAIGRGRFCWCLMERIKVAVAGTNDDGGGEATDGHQSI